MSADINIKNRRASFEYHFLDRWVAGIQLTGTEIKSIRESKASVAEAFCVFTNGELWVKNMTIQPYSRGSYSNHDPKRLRKLLLQKKELRKIETNLQEKGLTIIPIKLFINERGLAKLEIALARGKKIYDKREDIKLKDARREMGRAKRQ
jgi:SsrA-binding protein